MLKPIFSVKTVSDEFKIGGHINGKEIFQFEFLKESDEYHEGIYIYTNNLSIIGFVPKSNITLITYCQD